MIKKLDFIEEICLYLFVFFCCFPQKISSTFLIVYGAVFLLNRITQLFVNKTFSIIISKRTIPAIILICFSLISFITLIYVDSTESALKRMFEQRLTLLLLPLVALLKQNKLDFSAFLKVFVLGNFFFVVYSFLYVIYQYWIIENVILQRDFLANFTHICCALQYRTYACFNLVISYAALFYLLSKKCVTKGFSIFYFILTFLFFILNNSRAEDIALLFVLGVILFYIFKQNKLKTILVIIGVLFLSIGSVKLFPDSRLAIQVNKILEKKDVTAFEDPRMYIWKSATNLIKEHPIIGYGVNNYENALVAEYEKSGFQQGFISKYNTHNQFLGFQLEFGIVGPILLLILLLSFSFFSDKDERLFYFQLSGILVLSLFFENMLDRYAGCVTLALFVFSFSSINQPIRDSFKKNWDKIIYFFTIVVLLLVLFTIYKDRHNTEGYFIDKNLFSRSSENELIYDFIEEIEHPSEDNGTILAFNEIAILNGNANQRTQFSIECYVDSSYNGLAVGMVVEDEARQVHGVTIYDLAEKGVWQTLHLEIPSGRKCIVLFSRIVRYNKMPIQFKNPKVIKAVN